MKKKILIFISVLGILASALPTWAYNRAALQQQLHQKARAVRSYSGSDELVEAVKQGAVAKVQMLLKQGENPNEPDEYGKTPFMYAMQPGRAEVLEQLFNGYDDYMEKQNIPEEKRWAILRDCMTRTDGQGRNLLMLAAESGDVDLVDMVLNVYDNAVAGDDKKMEQYINLADARGTTALMYAVGSGFAETVEKIIYFGEEVNGLIRIDIFRKDEQGRTAFEYAKRGESDPVLKPLKELRDTLQQNDSSICRSRGALCGS